MWPILTPGVWLAGFIKGTTSHCYTQNIKALGFVVSEIFTFSYFKSMGAYDPRDVIGRINVGYH